MRYPTVGPMWGTGATVTLAPSRSNTPWSTSWKRNWPGSASISTGKYGGDMKVRTASHSGPDSWVGA